MRIVTTPGRTVWLAYGMNVHPGGDVHALHDALDHTVMPLRARLGTPAPFGLALRLSAQGVDAARRDPTLRDELRARLDAGALTPFTGNAFVLGSFHGEPLKDRVYRPPWGDRARTRYTLDFAEFLAGLNQPGARCSLSTSPGAWRHWTAQPTEEERAAAFATCAQGLRRLHDRTGVHVQLAVEPEPGCSLQTTEEVVAFFQGPLSDALRREHPGAAEHIGLCYDVCHQAVMHEDVVASLAHLRDEGIPVAKLQASCALEVPDPANAQTRVALSRFDEPTYLHQVVGRDRTGTLRMAADLSDALGDAGWHELPAWRVHFHVPVFRRDAVPPLRTTRDDLDRALRYVVQYDVTDHIEIETYTWDVLPEDERHAGSGLDLVDALTKEYAAVIGVLTEGPSEDAA